MTPTQRAAALRLIEFETLPRRLLDIACRVRVNECLFHDDEFVDDASHALKEAIDLLRELAAEPVAWHVCSVNSDGSLSLEFAAPWEELAHEHINDAINEHDIDGATSWVVRPVYTHPPQQRKPLSDEQLKQAMSDAGVRVFQPGLWDVLLDAGRAIEHAHGIIGEPT